MQISLQFDELFDQKFENSNLINSINLLGHPVIIVDLRRYLLLRCNSQQSTFGQKSSSSHLSQSSSTKSSSGSQAQGRDDKGSNGDRSGGGQDHAEADQSNAEKDDGLHLE